MSDTAETGYGTLFRNVAASIAESDPGAAQALQRAAIDVEEAFGELRHLRKTLRWYDDHKRTDGFYDGNLWGDLSAALGDGEPR